MYIVPIFYSVWCLSSITMGALFFNEFDNFQLGNFIFFIIGVVLDITGGIMLQYRQIETTNITTQDGKKTHNENNNDEKIVAKDISQKESEDFSIPM